MRPPLNDDLKQLFYAHYYGQEVQQEKGRIIPVTLSSLLLGIRGTYLQLRSLSSMTDEDLAELSEFCVEKVDVVYNMQDQPMICIDNATSHTEYGMAIDWLRSHGFAIDFMGYSVDELVAAGWIKLKEE